MSEQQQQQTKPPTNSPPYHRASAPSPSEPGSRFPSEGPPSNEKPKPVEHTIIDPRYGDGVSTLKASYMETEMRGSLTDAVEASREFGYIMDATAKKMGTAQNRLMLISGEKLDALMEVTLELKEENRKLKKRVKELEEEKTQSSSS